MPEEHEIYKAAIDVAKDLIKDTIVAGLKATKAEAAKLSTDFDFIFRKFLDRNEKALNSIRLILNPSKPVKIDGFFEPPSLILDKKVVAYADTFQLIRELKYMVISGRGGSGKSILLKMLFIKLKREKWGRIPFYIELRAIKDKRLFDYLLTILNSIRRSIDPAAFEYALSQGKFLFLFDGLDEVDVAHRASLVADIHEFVYKYDLNLYVVSSRPDLELNSWNEFHEAKIQGFSKEQVISLTQKLEYDQETKKNFVHLVDNSLYASHGTYLSNPLLCLIMLMTFEGGADIPTHLHLFFSQAFDVLFYRHDATKGDPIDENLKLTLISMIFERFCQGLAFSAMFLRGQPCKVTTRRSLPDKPSSFSTKPALRRTFFMI